MLNRCTARYRLLTCILPVLVALLATLPAFGQATGGLLPDPITSTDLDSYARKLELSSQQRQAVDAYHSSYLDQFEELRSSEIEDLITRVREARRGMMRLQDYDEIKKSMKDLQRMENRIRSLDEGFFGQAQTVLAEDQQAVFPRVVQQRERARYQYGGMMFGPRNAAAQVDLSELTSTMDLTPEQTAAIDTVLANYERLLTTSLRDLHQASSSSILDGLAKLEEMGFNEQTMSDRRGAMQMFDAVRTIMQEIMGKIAKQAAEIGDLNQSTLRQVSALLPDETAQDLRWKYQRRAYPEIGAQGAQVARSYEMALELDGLSDDQLAAIAAGRADFIRRDNLIADDLITLMDEDRESGGFMGFGQDEGQADRRQKTRELRESARTLRESAMEALEGLLGPEMSGSVRTRMASESSGDVQRVAVPGPGFGGPGGGGFGGPDGGAPGGPPPEPDGAEDDSSSYLFLPGPISARELKTWAGYLGIPESNQFILDSLYDDYRQEHKQWATTHLDPVRALRREMMTPRDGDGPPEPPSEDTVERMSDLRSGALEALRQLDASFLEDIALLVEPDDDAPPPLATATRLALLRDRQVYKSAAQASDLPMGGPMGRGRGDSQGEASVDLVILLFDADLDPALYADIEPYAAAWEQAATASLRSRYDETINLARSTVNMMRRFARQGGRGPRGGGGRPNFDPQAFETMREQRQRLEDSTRALTTLNRGTLDDLASILPPDVAAALRTAYLSQAYSDLLDDPSSVEPVFDTVLAMADLPAHQRSRVEELQIEYMSEYSLIADEMIQARQAASDDSEDPEDRPNWEQSAAARTQTERLRFRRNELNSKTILRLKGLLTEQQAARIPRLSAMD